MSEKDDQDWFEILAGRKVANADAATVKEAQALRRAILAQKADDVPGFDVEAGAQKLLFRMRREGLGGNSRKTWQIAGAFAIAATVVLSVSVIVMQPPSVDEEVVYRGIGPQVITAADAAQLAATLTTELESLGITAKVTRFGTTHTLNAPWPAKAGAQQSEFLKRHKLKQPTDGTLTVEITQAPPKP